MLPIMKILLLLTAVSWLAYPQMKNSQSFSSVSLHGYWTAQGGRIVICLKYHAMCPV